MQLSFFFAPAALLVTVVKSLPRSLNDEGYLNFDSTFNNEEFSTSDLTAQGSFNELIASLNVPDDVNSRPWISDDGGETTSGSIFDAEGVSTPNLIALGPAGESTDTSSIPDDIDFSSQIFDNTGVSTGDLIASDSSNDLIPTFDDPSALNNWQEPPFTISGNVEDNPAVKAVVSIYSVRYCCDFVNPSAAHCNRYEPPTQCLKTSVLCRGDRAGGPQQSDCEPEFSDVSPLTQPLEFLQKLSDATFEAFAVPLAVVAVLCSAMNLLSFGGWTCKIGE